MIDINEWLKVPGRVNELLAAAEQVKSAHFQAASAAGILPVSLATWEPETGGIAIYTPHKLSEKTASAYVEKFAYPTQSIMLREFAQQQPDWTREIFIKLGAAIPGVKHVFEGGNALMLGPTPLSNGIVSALMLGGLGYGAGTLAENLFPARYVQRGKLRRTLGITGALGGLGLGALNAHSNAKAMDTSFLKGLITNNKAIPPYLKEYEKQSAQFGSFYSDDFTGLHKPSILVPQFNSMVWNDVNKGMYNPYGGHTSPSIGAATTGFMGGLAAQRRSSIISPSTVINGIASAGVGLATANLAGRALSALAGLTPEAQNKLQDMGLYGGMLHAIVPPMFGRR